MKLLLTKNEVIERLGISKATLDRMRARGDGPREFRPRKGKVDGRPRWTLEAVEKWLSDGR